MRVASTIIRRLISSPRRVAAVDDQRTWRAYELYVGALHLARTIKRTTDAEHIGLMLPTSGLFPMAMLGTWILGRTVVPLNYLLKAHELEYIIDDAKLDTVITVTAMADFVGGLPQRVQQIRLDELSFKGVPPFRRARRRPENHLAVLLYTSGTSGRPKGVMLTSANLHANVRQCAQWARFTRDDVLLSVLPQFHSFGLTVLTLLPLVVGCTAVYTARFMPRKMLSLLREHRPTALIAIPSIFKALFHAKGATSDDFKSLRYIVSGGEPLPGAIFDGFRDRFGVTIKEGYGLTETGPVSNWNRPEDGHFKSVGMPLPDVQEKIVAPDGTRLGVDEEGEICIRGPNIMAGYYKRPDETAAVFDDEGYFKTGDMGRIDTDGYLYITGRIKEMLIIAGENVFPREIEEVLNAHASVLDSAVIGVQDSSRGEVALAFVELNDGATFDETALRAYCRDHLAQFKVPREIRPIDMLPRNPTGKIMRRELSDETPSAIQGSAGSES
ncbi:MAG: AMP-binding protein [Phycisphaerales bacterium]